MSFNHLGLAEPVLRALVEAGYTIPTPIQEQAIPSALAGRDIFGCAQTGTGKTAAFVVPMLHHLTPDQADQTAGRKRRPIRALILTPTRELAAQIGESIATYGAHLPLRHAVIYGGVGQAPQTDALRRGIDLLVACPGRLLDLMGQSLVDLSHVDHLVLDEADRMLDMGFIRDVRRIIDAVPTRRQTLLFSATIPDEIKHLAADLLIDPVHVQIENLSPAAETVTQEIYHVGRKSKIALLKYLLKNRDMRRILVFTRTKHGADRVAKYLNKDFIRTEAIHGNKSQNARTRALAAFKEGKVRVLVASDIASRGIDIDAVTHVVNFELPHEAETYVHRIGRTGRAGNSGQAISFCEQEEQPRLLRIQRLIKQCIPVVKDHPYVESLAADLPQPARTGDAVPFWQRPNRNGPRSPRGGSRQHRSRRHDGN